MMSIAARTLRTITPRQQQGKGARVYHALPNGVFMEVMMSLLRSRIGARSDASVTLAPQSARERASSLGVIFDQ